MARMEHFESLLEALGIKGTTSAKRRQKRLVGREKRWARTMLHQTSRRFVNSLKDGEYFALEGNCRSRKTVGSPAKTILRPFEAGPSPGCCACSATMRRCWGLRGLCQTGLYIAALTPVRHHP
jgi:hypothetical protein